MLGRRCRQIDGPSRRESAGHVTMPGSINKQLYPVCCVLHQDGMHRPTSPQQVWRTILI